MPHPLEPTARGELLLPHARRVPEAHDAAVAELDGPSLEGTLRFGCAEDLDGPSAPVDALGRLPRESLAPPGTRPLRAQDDARDG